MSERSTGSGSGPTACPFVAFEHDRGRRSTAPDLRHCCWAEALPLAVSISHQASHCLAADFPACPTFQDWARREAAKAAPAGPVPVSGPPDAGEYQPAADGIRGGHAGRADDWAAPPPWLAATPGEGGARERGGQLRAFDDLDARAGAPAPGRSGVPAADAAAAAAAAAAGADELAALVRSPVRPPGSTGEGLVWSPDDRFGSPPEAQEGDAGPAVEAAPFLAGRGRMAAGPTGPAHAIASDPAAYRQARPAGRRPRADATAPPWEPPRRAEQFGRLRTRGGVPSLPASLLGLAALAMAALVLFLLPGLFSGPGRPATSPTPSATATSVAASPTPLASPSPGGQAYVVKSGDLFNRIAAKFGLTPDQLAAANPQVTNRDKLQIGDQLVIPPPGTAAPSGSAKPSP